MTRREHPGAVRADGRRKRASRVAGFGAAVVTCGLVAFWVTGTFHWAYLAALGSLLWLTARAGGAPRRPPSPLA